VLDQSTGLSMALIDLDHFKRVNDAASHEAGDIVLQQVANLLSDAAADSGLAARLGGEESLLILPGVDRVEAAQRCEQVRRAVATHDWRPITGAIPVTASIGVTTMVGGQPTSSELLAQADRNLYAAKRSGRNRVVADPA
jgi:diguanylate cyclase (GGDEF)-like protein